MSSLVGERARKALALVVSGLATTAGGAATAHASVTQYLNVDAAGHCPRHGDLEICTGQIPSFDGAKLDVDITLPPGARLRADPAAADPGHPLIVMVHGAGGTEPNKYEFQSTTDEADNGERFRWNSHWFASHGYYVITPTQRGYRNDGPTSAWQPRTPVGSSVDLPNGTIKLTSREFSARDDQWLAAQVARSFDVDTDRVAITGKTSGGGESWQLATEPRWPFPKQLDPTLPELRLRAALPRTTWTDLLYSFGPHGHGGGPGGADIHESAYGAPGDVGPRPGLFGTPKLSYLAFVYALVANKQGVLEAGTTVTPSQEGPINLHAWFGRTLLGDPESLFGSEDPLVSQIRRGLTFFRSSYYLPQAWNAQSPSERVAVFAIQGWTDDLFTAVEPFRQFLYLKRLDQDWPIRIALADVGNARAQNPKPVWRALNAEAWDWLQQAIGGQPAQPSLREPEVMSFPTLCGSQRTEDAVGQPVAGDSPSGLSHGSLSVGYGGGTLLTPVSGLVDADGLASEPNLGVRLSPCLASLGLPGTGYRAVSAPLGQDVTYVGLGSVRIPYRLLTGNRASLNVRVWDVPPAGTPAPDDKTLLVTRGTYSILAPNHDPRSGTAQVPLFGNHWPLRRGHRLRLDVSSVDLPYFRPANIPTLVTMGSPRLILPLAEPTTGSLGGG